MTYLKNNQHYLEKRDRCWCREVPSSNNYFLWDEINITEDWKKYRHLNHCVFQLFPLPLYLCFTLYEKDRIYHICNLGPLCDKVENHSTSHPRQKQKYAETVLLCRPLLNAVLIPSTHSSATHSSFLWWPFPSHA